MKNNHFIAISCIFVILGLYVLHSDLGFLQLSASAQTLNCPPTYGQNNPAKWGKGNFVKIKIHSAFTLAERESIIAAFNEWNSKNVLNCSGYKKCCNCRSTA